jgi:SNF2 family DNA or RNA helicase
MLRRDKRLIADQLPRKSDAIVFCRLAPAQVAAYRAVLALPDVAYLAACAGPCACGSGDRGADCCLGDPYQ